MGRRAVAMIEPVGGHGGADHYDYALSMGLARNGVEMHYFTCPETEEVRYENLETHFFFSKIWSVKNKFLRLRNMARGMRRTLKLVKEKDIEIVHFQFYDLKPLNLMMLKMCKSRNLKVVVTLHDIEGFHGRTLKSVEESCFKRINEIIVHNSICKDHLARKLKDREIHIIPHGHYRDFFEKLPAKEKAVNGPLELLFFGQIKKVKGLEILLEAISKLGDRKQDIHLKIAGKPWHTNPETYTNLISELGISDQVSTRFEYIPNDELPQLFSSIDLVVLPYKQIYQSGVLMMAMTIGRPCITSDLDTFEDIITDGQDGYLFESENPDALAQKIIEILDSDNLNTIVENANSMIETKLNWDVIANQTINVYERLNLTK